MKRNPIVTGLIAAALMLPAAGFGADGENRAKAREFVKDSMITTKVKAELAKEKPSTLVKVSVDTDKSGIVVLSGTAKTQADKERAESIARGVKDVKVIENNIQVKAD